MWLIWSLTPIKRQERACIPQIVEQQATFWLSDPYWDQAQPTSNVSMSLRQLNLDLSNVIARQQYCKSRCASSNENFLLNGGATPELGDFHRSIGLFKS
jgi:hypothetical protein